MRTSLHKLLILCCALYLSGAHWAVLQTTAWTGMLVSRSIAGSVTDAFETTFDGQHPCSLCSAIAEGKQTEGQAEQSLDLLKKAGDVKFLELAPIECFPVYVGTSFRWPVDGFGYSVRFQTPPTPPPLA